VDIVRIDGLCAAGLDRDPFQLFCPFQIAPYAAFSNSALEARRSRISPLKARALTQATLMWKLRDPRHGAI
jgi:hypothetical protein